MKLFSRDEKVFAESVSALAYCNPFLPERIEYERSALGPDFVRDEQVWNVRAEIQEEPENVRRLRRQMSSFAADVFNRLSAGAAATPSEKRLYADVVLYWLYDKYQVAFLPLLAEEHDALEEDRQQDLPFGEFKEDANRLLAAAGRAHFPDSGELAHLFACFFQIRRAFHYIFRFIAGGSMPAARLRAAVWQSIFTHDIHRYRRTLFRCMGDFATLIVGPSGTGKELVARAIALSQYIPFDHRRKRFAGLMEPRFFALNLSALSPTLIESELFGHRSGAFTGASEDHVGWLESCGAYGSVFLDEIGEIPASIQVKLLRVLESRRFQRLGETQDRPFAGKIIAATNRDLAEEMRHGRFRQDLYYRLCADTVKAPSLREQILDSPGELRNLIHFIARRVVGGEEAEHLASEAFGWISSELNDYDWPGNVRELSQCIRNILIRKEYRPAHTEPSDSADRALQAVTRGEWDAEQLLAWYCTMVYEQTENLSETARRLGLDRRTIRRHMENYAASAAAG